MILDSSAVVAIIRDEPGAEALLRAVTDAESVSISAATFVETCLVIDGRGDPVQSRLLDRLLQDQAVRTVDFTAQQARIAREAFRDYGKGSGHPARLNLGDCYAYALAKATGVPLLFKGDDFGHTDVRSAL